MLKTIFIDIDNTILSFSEYVKKAMKDGFFKFNLKPYEDWMFDTFNRINDDLWHQIEEGTLTLEELKKIRWNLIFEELGIEYDGPEFEEYFRGELFSSAILEPGAVDMLEYLSKRYVLCAASNGPYDQQINRLKVGGVDKYFSYIFVSSKVGASKPSRGFFDCCFKELNEGEGTIYLPQEAMIIGDSVNADVIGGKNYGMKTCLYRAQGDLGEMIPEADYVIGSLMDVVELL